MLTLKQIVDRTDKLRQYNAKFVRFLRVKKGRDANGHGFIAVQSVSNKVMRPDGRVITKDESTKYITMVTFVDDKLHCKCSCSCPDFLYTWEVALNKKRAAEIEYSNGESPDIRNPARVAGTCKHLVALYYRIQKHIEG